MYFPYFFQIWKLELREIKYLPQEHTVANGKPELGHKSDRFWKPLLFPGHCVQMGIRESAHLTFLIFPIHLLFFPLTLHVTQQECNLFIYTQEEDPQII